MNGLVNYFPVELPYCAEVFVDFRKSKLTCILRNAQQVGVRMGLVVNSDCGLCTIRSYRDAVRDKRVHIYLKRWV